jgi:hypothetical protein
VVENRVLRRIFGPQRGGQRRLHNEELRNFVVLDFGAV